MVTIPQSLTEYRCPTPCSVGYLRYLRYMYLPGKEGNGRPALYAKAIGRVLSSLCVRPSVAIEQHDDTRVDEMGELNEF